MANNSGPQQYTPEMNLQTRNYLLQNCVPMFQQIYGVGQDPSANNVFNIPIQNVGLIRGFLVKIEGTIRNTSNAVDAALTGLGLANLIKQVVFSDMNNTTRIQTAGWHLSLVNSAKQPLVFGGAYSPNVPVKYGANWPVDTAPATITHSGTDDAFVSYYFYVPLAYSKTDLRGAMYAGLVGATSTLQITLNTAVGVAAGADPTLAVYQGGTAVWKAATNVTVSVWQDYLDQVPIQSNGQPLLPLIDMSVMYELKNASQAGLVVGQDFLMPYSNLRSFYSTTVIFDNAGNLNVGNDVNYWSLNAANTTALFKYGPNEAALMARSVFAADPPPGVYHFSHRDRPINTQQFGNITLTLNPKVVSGPTANVLLGYEDMATLDQVQFAQSIAA